MKTTNMFAAVMALMLSSAGFMAIDYLFTHSSSWHEQHAAEVVEQL